MQVATPRLVTRSVARTDPPLRSSPSIFRHGGAELGRHGERGSDRFAALLQTSARRRRVVHMRGTSNSLRASAAPSLRVEISVETALRERARTVPALLRLVPPRTS